MKLEDFKYIEEIARTKSINKAAENLYLSQPYLSSTLKELEKELGIVLFDRSRQGVRLTDTGIHFLKYADQINHIIRQVKLLKSHVGLSQLTTLKVASIFSFAMMDFFLCNQCTDSDLHIIYDEMWNHQVIDYVAEGHYDLGIIYVPFSDENYIMALLKSKNLKFHVIAKERIHIVVGQQHPLFQHDTVEPGECTSYPFCIDPYSMEYYEQMLLTLFGNQIFDPLIINNTRSQMYYISKSERAYSIGYKFLNLTNPFVEAGSLRYIPLETDKNYYVLTGYIYNANQTQSLLASDYIRQIEIYFQGVDLL